MTRFAQAKQNRNRVEAMALTNRNLGAFLLPLSLVFVLGFLTVSYLILMNAMTQKSYEIKKMQAGVSELKHNNEKLEVAIAERESIANLSARVAALGMVPTEKIDYVTALSGEVALK